MDNYTRDYLTEQFDVAVFDADEVTEWRKPINGIEAEGVVYMAARWIEDNLYGEDIQSAYDNIYGWRDNMMGGSFNVVDNFRLFDPEEILEIDDVILKGNCVYLEVYNTDLDKAVAYIRIN